MADILAGIARVWAPLPVEVATRQRAWDTLGRAFDLYVGLGDHESAADLAAEPFNSASLTGIVDVTWRALKLVDPGSEKASWLHARHAIALMDEPGDLEGARATLDRAMALARAHGNRSLEARALAYLAQDETARRPPSYRTRRWPSRRSSACGRSPSASWRGGRYCGHEGCAGAPYDVIPALPRGPARPATGSAPNPFEGLLRLCARDSRQHPSNPRRQRGPVCCSRSQPGPRPSSPPRVPAAVKPASSFPPPRRQAHPLSAQLPPPERHCQRRSAHRSRHPPRPRQAQPPHQPPRGSLPASPAPSRRPTSRRPRSP